MNNQIRHRFLHIYHLKAQIQYNNLDNDHQCHCKFYNLGLQFHINRLSSKMFSKHIEHKFRQLIKHTNWKQHFHQ